MLQMIGRGWQRAFGEAQKRCRYGNRPSRAYLQQEHQQDAEHDDLKLTRFAQQLGQQVLQPCLQQHVTSVAPSTAPQTLTAPPTTAMNRYSMP